MQPTNTFDEALDRIVANDPRYHRDAYQFVREALDVAQKKFCGEQREPQHVSGRQLLEGVRDYALEEFGPMTLIVFQEWGITRCEDIGEIVFNMVDHTLLGKTDDDSRSDFQDGYDFDETFRVPFLPKAKKNVGSANLDDAVSHTNKKKDSKKPEST
ncbi:MAG: hypothetical protein CMO80_24425 [Verrucomicrobiales bacterium]|nr:hypothetical protein [Verrucomicrobiales bacterium]|tara:strand:+ start:10766 stop:11236 length:471 start_codon:yes stop_codon:yes gene_type:complete